MNYRTVLENSRAYNDFVGDVKGGHLNHCYMFLSEDAAALENLLLLCAAAVQCPDFGCGVCVECRKALDFNHHNIYFLPTKASVSDVRELQVDTLNLFDGTRVYIINDIAALSPQVQNTLLKTLEEPRENIVLLLGATNGKSVLETVKSRAKKIFLERFSVGVISDELRDISDDESAISIAAECCGGLLFKAEKILANKQYVVCYDKLINLFSNLKNSRQLAQLVGELPKDGESVSIILEIIEKLIENMLLYNTGLADATPTTVLIAKKYSVEALANFVELVTDAREHIKANCQATAVLENLFLSILEVAYKCR